MPAENRRDWSRLEVEVTVAAYMEMLDLELAGHSLNKTERRKALQPVLDNRSEGAIERKHQNISAILIELGYPYVEGYKPLSNYQRLLEEVVEDYLDRTPQLAAQIARVVAEPAGLPSADDILARIVPKPAVAKGPSYRYFAERKAVPTPRINYLVREAANKALGAAGEEFVIRYECARLRSAGQEKLARHVERVSATRGDYLGYDVLSFEVTGRERLIEVKTTGFGAFTPFFVSPNELEVSRTTRERYHLYRAFAFRRDPRLFAVPGALDQTCILSASEYVAHVR